MDDEVRYSAGVVGGGFRTWEEAALVAVSSRYAKSPMRLVLYELRPIRVDAVVRDMKWHFTLAEENK